MKGRIERNRNTTIQKAAPWGTQNEENERCLLCRQAPPVNQLYPYRKGHVASREGWQWHQLLSSILTDTFSSPLALSSERPKTFSQRAPLTHLHFLWPWRSGIPQRNRLVAARVFCLLSPQAICPLGNAAISPLCPSRKCRRENTN